MKKIVLFICILLFNCPQVQAMYLLQRSVRVIQDYLKKATEKPAQAEKLEKEQKEKIVAEQAAKAAVEEHAPEEAKIPRISGAGIEDIDYGLAPQVEEPTTKVFEGIEGLPILEGGLGDPTAQKEQPKKEEPSTSGSGYSQEERAVPEAEKRAELIELPALSEKDDYYFTLGVAQNATQEQIKKAYRKKILLYRGRPEDTTVLNTANEALSNPEAREAYNRAGLQGVQEYQESQRYLSQITGNIDGILIELGEKLRVKAYDRFLNSLAEQINPTIPGNFFNSMINLFYRSRLKEIALYAARFRGMISQLIPEYGNSPILQQALLQIRHFDFMVVNPVAYLKFIEAQKRFAQYGAYQQQLFDEMYQNFLVGEMIARLRDQIERIISITDQISAKDFYKRQTDQLLLDQALTVAQNFPPLYFYVMRLYAIKASAYFENFQWPELRTVIDAAKNSYNRIKLMAQLTGYQLNDPSTKKANKDLKSYKPLLKKIESIIELNKELEKYIQIKKPVTLKDKAEKIKEKRFSIPQLFSMKKIKAPKDFAITNLAIPIIDFLDIFYYKLYSSSKEVDEKDAVEYKEDALEMLELAKDIAIEVNATKLKEDLKDKIKKIEKELYS